MSTNSENSQLSSRDEVPGAPLAVSSLSIPQHLLTQWQGFIDTMAEMIAVPAGLIMRVVEKDIEVFLASQTAGNPYHPGERENLIGSGLYCETVLRDRTGLLVPNALVDAHWRNNPDTKIGMVSYLGFPILWPDGSPFGTICVLDRKANAYTDAQKRLIEYFRATIESHLALIVEDFHRSQSVVNERLQRAEESQLSEERFRLLIEHTADDFFLHDDKGRILDVNRQACLNLGYSREEFLQMRVSRFSVGHTQEALEKLWEEMQPGVCSTLVTEHHHKDGRTFPVEVRISCLMVREQKTFFTLVRDISERVEADRSIRQLNMELEQRVIERTQQWRESSELLQGVMDGATDAIFVKDIEGRFLLFNRAAARFVGRQPEDVLGKHVADLFGEEAASKIREYELQVMQGGESSTVEEILLANGQERTFLSTRNPYRDEQGKVLGLIGISRDVTEMKRAEQALRDSETRWQFAVDGTGDGIWDWNLKTERVFYSRQWKTMLGHTEDEVGDTVSEWSDRVHPEDLPITWQIIQDHFKHQTSDFVTEHRMRASNGSWKWILNRGKVIERLPDGNPGRVIGTHTDITARKIAEDELFLERERLKMATQALGLGVWDYNLDANTILCDERWHEIFGVNAGSPAETIEIFNTYVHPDDVERVTQERLAALAAKEPIHQIDFRIQRPGGDTRWIMSSARWLEGNARTPNRLVGIVMDVTERRLAEDKLQQSYEALRQAEKLAKIGSWTLDLESSIFTSSDMLNEMNGLLPGDPPLTTDSLQKMFSPEDYEKVQAGVEQCIANGTPYEIEVEHLRRNGTSYTAHIRGQANRDASGRIFGLAGTVQDISEREEARARLATLADNLPNGAIYRLEYIGDRFALTYISAGIFSLIGVQATELVADPQLFLHAIHEEDLPRYQATLEHSSVTREVFNSQFRMKTRDGDFIWVHSRSAPRYQLDGTTVWDGIMQDITMERQVAEALQRAKETAEAAEHAKSDFLATMSHEIRTPMNTVIGMTRLTLQTDISPKQRNYLEKIDSSAKTLLSIINDVLDFSKIEAGKLELEDAEFQLESILESVSNVTAMRAEEKGLEIAYAVDPRVPRRLRGDPLRVGQVLINLISNAVKFTHTGEVIVSVGVAEGRADGVALQFSIKDTGIGLDSHQIEGLFRAFSQADSRVSRKYGGTGLGLAICKQLVEMMGGRIWVESQPGIGSTFFFTIQVALSLETNVQFTGTLNNRSLVDRRVLIVDDNASARQILFDMVRDFGMSPETVDSGVEALVALKSASQEGRPFDLVLMDWRMPGMDGLETARRIRIERDLAQMPAVLMVTAYGRDEVLRSVEKLGLQGILIKPITESVLFNTIMDILDLVNSDNTKLESPRDSALRGRLPYTNEELSVLTGRRVLVVDDNALNREVVTDFLIAVGMVVQTAVNGHDALVQLERADYDVVLMDMHMPEGDGLTATREIRGYDRWSKLPIIALTAQARIEDRNASLAAGMAAHLTKPIDEAVLYKTLIEVLRGTLTSELGHEDVKAVQLISVTNQDTISIPSKGPDILAALGRLGGNQDRLLRLLHGFLHDYEGASEQMSVHLEESDTAKIVALAHMVKGAASYFDAHELCGVADVLERAAARGDLEETKRQVPIFQKSLEGLLQYLKESMTAFPEQPTASTRVDLDAILRLLEKAEPLVASGDYAAQVFLEQISAGLSKKEHTMLAEEARQYYEDLELEAAKIALQKLKTSLQLRK
jgi:two-component system sensor histidine kinase/response regulator